MEASLFLRARRWVAAHETPVVASIATLALAIAIVLLVTLFTGGGSGGSAPAPNATPSAPRKLVAPPPTALTPSQVGSEEWSVPSVDKGSLPVVDPWAITPDAPVDPRPWEMPDGTIVVPRSADGATLYDAPRGTPFGLLPLEQYRSKSAYPVIAREGQWLQVLLTSRRALPSEGGEQAVNGATGWVRAEDVKVSRSEYQIVVNLAKGNATLTRGGRVIVTTQAGIGTEQTPTPEGRTFVMTVFTDPSITYSHVMVGLGAHSTALDSFSGGPAPIAIHAGATHTGRISNGCVRVPSDLLDQFAKVPTGTPVLIVSGTATHA